MVGYRMKSKDIQVDLWRFKKKQQESKGVEPAEPKSTGTEAESAVTEAAGMAVQGAEGTPQGLGMLEAAGRVEGMQLEEADPR